MSDAPPPGELPTTAERTRAFNAARLAEISAQIALIKDTEGEIVRLLKAAAEEIARTLAGAPTEFQSWRLTQLKAEVTRVLGEFQAAATARASDAMGKSWDAGLALVDKPLEAASVAYSPVALDGTALQGMRAFTTAKIGGVSAEIVNKVNGELANVMLGMQTPHEAMTKVRDLIGSGGEKRATTIVRTELGRAWSTATQARMEQASDQVKGLMKQWRRSGKRLARHEHEAIDGQIRKVDEPFLLGDVTLMYPRDPKGPAKHTINCGCMSLPYMASWEVVHPKEQPFSRDELNVSNTRRLLEDSRHAEFEDRARALWSGKAHADGSFLTAGRIDDDVLAALKEQGFTPATREIAVSDRELLHMRRDAKVGRKSQAGDSAALPEKLLVNLPGLMERPKAIYLERPGTGWRRKESASDAAATLIYVLDGPANAAGDLPKVVVKVNKKIERNKHEAHNWMTTAGYVQRGQLAGDKYIPVRALKSGADGQTG
jgi:hypothetical protein